MENLVWLCYNKTKIFLDKEVPQPKELTEAEKDELNEDKNPNKAPIVNVTKEKDWVKENL